MGTQSVTCQPGEQAVLVAAHEFVFPDADDLPTPRAKFAVHAAVAGLVALACVDTMKSAGNGAIDRS